jgi:uncharacterized membrane protein YphA (DoxX/SURF4 family)
MKIVLTVFRWLVGLLFIFSGLIKANDPLGLSYKMQEFFEAWGFDFLNNYTLSFAYGINVLEVVAGVAIILAWQPKFFTWLILLLITFFTFLTSYVLFSNKIKACGCFGDCVPLTPNQTFTKDLILLALILFIFYNLKKITPLFASKVSIIILLISFVLVNALQIKALLHLPYLDCLPYKKGNNLLQQMQAPKGSVGDSILVSMSYKKQGKTVEIVGDNYPDDFSDNLYQYIEGSRLDKVIRKGNNTPKITELTLTPFGDSVNIAPSLFESTEKYVLIFAKEMPKKLSDVPSFFRYKTLRNLMNNGIKIYVVTGDMQGVQRIVVPGTTILKCDGTVVKTAARVNPTFFVMQGATILEKKAGDDFDDKLIR